MAFLLHSSEFAPPGIGAQQVGESLTHHSRQRLDWCFMIADRSQASHESTEILVPFSDPRSIFRTPRTTWRRSVHPFVTQRMCPASADLSRPSSASGVHLKPEIIVRRVLGTTPTATCLSRLLSPVKLVAMEQSCLVWMSDFDAVI